MKLFQTHHKTSDQWFKLMKLTFEMGTHFTIICEIWPIKASMLMTVSWKAKTQIRYLQYLWCCGYVITLIADNNNVSITSAATEQTQEQTNRSPNNNDIRKHLNTGAWHLKTTYLQRITNNLFKFVISVYYETHHSYSEENQYLSKQRQTMHSTTQPPPP